MFKNYIKITWKVLSRKRLYTLVTLLGISFPIIIITLVVSFLTHITSNSYPQTRFDRVVNIDNFYMKITKQDGDWRKFGINVPYKFYEDYIKHYHTPELVSFYQDSYETEISGNNKNKRLRVKYTDENFWKIADYKFIEGKAFDENDVDNANRYAVIDERTKAYFFGNSSPIGKNLTIREKNYKIIGVVKNADAAKFRTYANAFIPVSTDEGLYASDYLSGDGKVLALLKNKRDKKLLANELKKTVANFDLEQIRDSKKVSTKISDTGFASLVTYNLNHLFNIEINKNYVVIVSVVLLLFFFVILPALNLIYINLSRVSERYEEVGIRKGFGGSRKTIFKQFIFENVFITILGGTIALIVSAMILFLIDRSQILPGYYIKINGTAFLICMLIWLVLSFMSGVLPAMRISRVQVISAIHGVFNKNGIYANKWMKSENTWLSVELCCVFIALFSIINFFVFFGLNLFTPVGFIYKGIYEVGITDQTKNLIYQDHFSKDVVFKWIAQNPKVSETSRLTGCNPYEGGESYFDTSLIYENKVIKGKNILRVELGIGDWNLWKLNLIEGNWINADDTISCICPVLINNKLRKALFGTGTAVGRQFKIGDQKLVVKGIIKAFKPSGELTSEGYYLFYVDNPKYSFRVSGGETRNITGYVRFRGDGAINSQKLLDQLHTKYPDFSITINPLEKFRTESLRKSIIPLLFILFLCLSVFFIVLFGMFGVIWYKINRRVPEIGLRKSVGATITRIFREVLSEAYLITLFGLLAGIVIIIQFPLLGVFDFSIPVYLLSILITSLIMFLLVGIFTLLPARKAAKIQPAMALHEE